MDNVFLTVQPLDNALSNCPMAGGFGGGSISGWTILKCILGNGGADAMLVMVVINLVVLLVVLMVLKISVGVAGRIVIGLVYSSLS